MGEPFHFTNLEFGPYCETMFNAQAGFSWLAVHKLLAFQGTPVALDSLVFSTATPVAMNFMNFMDMIDCRYPGMEV